MRIGIDVRLLAIPRGIGNFIRSLLSGLSASETHHEFFLYADSPRTFECLTLGERFHARVVSPAFYPIWEHRVLPAAIRHDSIEVLHCPANTAPIVSLRETRLVLTVHDVIFMTESMAGVSLRHRAQYLYYRLFVPRAARKAHTIVTDSRYSKSEITSHTRVPESKVTVINLAPQRHFHVLTAAEVDGAKKLYHLDRFFVAPAAEDPRKNTVRVIDCFAEFLRVRGHTHRLVLFGLTDAARARFQRYAEERGIASHVTLLGFISNQDVVALYNAAEVAIYMSLSEGFGLPILEAMACGAPVLCANSASIPEVAADAAVLVQPQDTEAMTSALIDLSSEPGKREKLRNAGLARAQQFSERRMASEYLSAYEGSVQERY